MAVHCTVTETCLQVKSNEVSCGTYRYLNLYKMECGLRSSHEMKKKKMKKAELEVELNPARDR